MGTCRKCSDDYVGVDDVCWDCCEKEAYEHQYRSPLAMERIDSNLLAVISAKESVLLDDGIERDIEYVIYWAGSHYFLRTMTTGDGKRPWYESTTIRRCFNSLDDKGFVPYGPVLMSLPVFTCGPDKVLKFFKRWSEEHLPDEQFSVF